MCRAFKTLGFLVILSLTVGFATSFGQSLGELARKQRQKRTQQTESPPRVFTNDNIPTRGGGIPEVTAESPAGSKQPVEGQQPAEDPPTTGLRCRPRQPPTRPGPLHNALPGRGGN